MPLYLLQMFSDTINSAAYFLAISWSAFDGHPVEEDVAAEFIAAAVRFHELDYIQLTSVNCTHFVNRHMLLLLLLLQLLMLLPPAAAAHM